MNKFIKYVVLGISTIAVHGCSDIGRKFKEKPDETVIQTNPDLTIPPHYQQAKASTQPQTLDLVKEPENKPVESMLFASSNERVQPTPGKSGITKGDQMLLNHLNMPERDIDTQDSHSTGDEAILKQTQPSTNLNLSKAKPNNKKIEKAKSTQGKYQAKSKKSYAKSTKKPVMSKKSKKSNKSKKPTQQG